MFTNVLTSNFPFTSGGISANYVFSSRWNVKSDLDLGRVVYFAGNASVFTKQKKVWLFWKKNETTYGAGHAWLCDGYEAKGNVCTQQFWYHMNWG